jgi:phenylacetate-coenzyme A ligase PaaK-like adenylate-forming protein
MPSTLRAIRGLHRVVSSSDRVFRWSTRTRTDALVSAGLPAAVEVARAAYRRCPAYRALLDERGGFPSGSPAEVLAALPVLTKSSYIDRWSAADRCIDGCLPTVGQVDESAGSSGAPYTWVRSRGEVVDVHTTIRRLVPLLAESGPMLVVNAFSMGAWATGTTTAEALAADHLVESPGPDAAKVLTLLSRLGGDRPVLLCGYPPFLLEVLDEAATAGVDLGRARLYAVTGGEALPEGTRRRLLRVFTRVYSAYGASDIDVGMACETPFSVAVRQAAESNPKLARALFGDDPRLPSVFAYDPTAYHHEVLADGTLATTVLRRVAQPRVRACVGDSGGVATWTHVCAVLRDHGVDPLALGAHDWRQPLVWVHGRADGTVSLWGANVYPDDVGRALTDDPVLSEAVRGWAIELAGTDEDPVPALHLEVAAGVDTDGLAPRAATTVDARLRAVNADYRTACAEHPAIATWRVSLHSAGTGPFAPDGRIKRRRVLGAAGSPTHTTDAAPGVPQDVVDRVLRDAARAPSAHNAQPCSLEKIGGASFGLRYDHTDYLPHDPNDRDALLGLGAFVETFVLAAERAGHVATWTGPVARVDGVIHAGTLEITAARVSPGALAMAAADRHMNRRPYKRGVRVPDALRADLTKDGAVAVEQRRVVPLVVQAAASSWHDARFVADLDRWTTFRHGPIQPELGMTPTALALSPLDRLGLRIAFFLGRHKRTLTGVFARVWADRDRQLARAASATYVVCTPSDDPALLLEAGRRLVRCWTATRAAGWALTPISIVVDRAETRAELAALASSVGAVGTPVALWRTGPEPRRGVPRSGRRAVRVATRCADLRSRG